MTQEIAYCTYEDRRHTGIGLKLLLLSYARHGGRSPFYVFLRYPLDGFEDWCARHAPFAIVRPCTSTLFGWNTKTWCVFELFKEGHGRVAWIDSDMILGGDADTELFRHDPSVFLVSSNTGGTHMPIRAEYWGLKVERKLTFSVNAGLFVASRTHEPFLREWQSILASDKFQNDVEKKDFSTRTLGLECGDQDVLEGLLMSKKDFPVHHLRTGNEVANCVGWFGYSFRERLANLGRGVPLVVHAQGAKPWYRVRGAKGMDSLFLQLTTFNIAAARYEKEVEEDTAWMWPDHPATRLYRRLTDWAPNFALLPFMVALKLKQRLSRRR